MNQYLSFDCPNCQKYCIYSNGDISDLTVGDVETVKCWNCKQVSKVPEYESELFELTLDEVYDRVSFPYHKIDD